jgi:hypothetical protein
MGRFVFPGSVEKLARASGRHVLFILPQASRMRRSDPHEQNIFNHRHAIVTGGAQGIGLCGRGRLAREKSPSFHDQCPDPASWYKIADYNQNPTMGVKTTG